MKLSEKGNFVPIDDSFIKDGISALKAVTRVQEIYSKNDTDTFINELRDSIVGSILGYKLINTNKHGFDCKKDVNSNIILEVKQSSFSAESWSATFNDTTYEKAELFTSKDLFLALAVWNNAAELMLLVYGNNAKIGEYLKSKIDGFKAGKSVRSTQTLSLNALVFEYGFKIYGVNRSQNEILSILEKKSSKFKNYDKNKILIINI